MKVSRRHFIETAGATSAISGTERAASAKQPNILFILADDHRADALGCMGNRIVQTPELDRLARDGAIFDNHFCTTPICCASRASIMLGQYAGTHGINDFKTPLSTEQVERTYWYQLKQAGYRIGFIGKFGVGDKMPGEQFNYWKAFPGQGFYFPQGPSGPHLTHIMRDQASEFIRTTPRDKPFCLSISFKAPHVQDESPEQYLPSSDTLSLYRDVKIPAPKGAGPDDVQRFPLAIQHSENRRRWGVRFATPDIYQASVKGYYRLISGIDGALGLIRAALEQSELADNTVIVYSADHGIFNGEHGFAGKWFGHEESVRIPLIIYDPRVARSSRGKRIAGMSLNIDLQPTVLELAGVHSPNLTQGRSLLPELRNEGPQDRSIWFFEHHFPNNGWIPSSEGVRTKRWKYLRYTDNAAPFEELYNLENDAIEVNNLAGKPEWTKQQAALRSYWQKWNTSLKDGTSWKEPVTSSDLEQDGLV